MAPVCSPSHFAVTFPSFLCWHNLLIFFLSSLPSVLICFTKSTMVSITAWYDLSTLRCTFSLHCVKYLSPPYKLLPPCLSFSTTMTVDWLIVSYLPTTPLPSAIYSFSSFFLNISDALISAQCTALNYMFINPNLLSPCLTKASPHPSDGTNHCHHSVWAISLFFLYLLPSSSSVLFRLLAVLGVRVIDSMIPMLICFDLTWMMPNSLNS